ncbi:AMP-binding protein [Pandoraea fibrosis]|uniref:AMP-binding protein n=1 Tax=Pandoraea fibrosis TaxID=1891094 RepID=A0ABX6HSF9_9BURK|nr:feruloyl-CoA synthase [Pandoraea fibrosis]QHE92660.1 AMP-binding protein [Pandoraea fibrosis]QHF13783.1 AMP-binding protein [Pandoraea fibrosis]
MDDRLSVAAAGARRLARPDIEREDRADGSFVIRSRTPLSEFARSPVDWLVQWATRTPDAVFVAERWQAGEGTSATDLWRRITYREALTMARGVGQALLDLAVPRERPVVILSDNSVNHALLVLGAMMAGRQTAIVSSAYSRVAKDMSKLHGILARLDPALVYVEDGEHYAGALADAPIRCPIVATRHARPDWLRFTALAATPASSALDDAFAQVRPEDTAKLLLTSGSTGKPKIVVNTHRMLAANQQMIAQCWHFIDEAAPVVVDWLPWSHTFGANHNFHMALRNGGAFYVDDGRPVPELIGRSVDNLRDVSPTLHFNVPKGFEALAPFLEEDDAFAARFFGRLQVLFYAAASLPPAVWQRFERIASRHCDTLPFFTSAWGATETSPLITSVHFPIPGAGNIGVPAPGNELKFVPNGDKLEMRVRGPSVFHRYVDDPDATANAFDDEGFYRTGDAGRLSDPEDPGAGVIFDGRVSEDFKLTSGTWVSVGALRLRAVTALAPYASDVVIAGHDRDEIGLLIFPSPAMRAKVAHAAQTPHAGKAMAMHDEVRAWIAQALAQLAQDAGSSQRAARAAVLASPPSLEQGEITDKGYVNQRAVLSLREEDVARLYSDCPSVIRLPLP